jgi:maltose phosphorylase
MATKTNKLLEILLTYRYNQLDKAIENAQNNLGFKNGCPLSNGYHEWEECHNEWEITHEEIHRNERLLLLF